MDFLANLLSSAVTITSKTQRSQNISIKFILDIPNEETHLRIYKNPKSALPFQESCPIFEDEFSPLSGKLVIQSGNISNNLPHTGIELEFSGVISPMSSNQPITIFTSHKINISPSGSINDDMIIPFNFSKLHFTYPSYDGDSIQIRYFLKAKINDTLIDKEKTLWFKTPKITSNPMSIIPFTFSCGLNNFFIAEISLNRSSFNITDLIEGSLTFSFLQMPLHSIGVALLRHEEYKSESMLSSLCSKEICLGTLPVGDCILWNLDLNIIDSNRFVPSEPFKNGIHNVFFMNYYLSIIVTDLSDRRYYKNEIISIV